MTGCNATLEAVFGKTQTYKTATFMALAAVLVSASIIVYYNTSAVPDGMGTATSGFSLTLSTLMPYMISAVIAAIAALGVMMMLPATRVLEPARQFATCLDEMREGDLTVRAVSYTHLTLPTN